MKPSNLQRQNTGSPMETCSFWQNSTDTNLQSSTDSGEAKMRILGKQTVQLGEFEPKRAAKSLEKDCFGAWWTH